MQSAVSQIQPHFSIGRPALLLLAAVLHALSPFHAAAYDIDSVKKQIADLVAEVGNLGDKTTIASCDKALSEAVLKSETLGPVCKEQRAKLQSLAAKMPAAEGKFAPVEQSFYKLTEKEQQNNIRLFLNVCSKHQDFANQLDRIKMRIALIDVLEKSLTLRDKLKNRGTAEPELQKLEKEVIGLKCHPYQIRNDLRSSVGQLPDHLTKVLDFVPKWRMNISC
jgi:hypothetical protein